MDLNKQYIIQAITFAANNLRLSSEKIEVVGMLREYIADAPSLDDEFRCMKKVTELAKLAIRLNECHLWLLQNRVDFLTIADKFREHAQGIILDLSYLLDTVNPVSFRQLLSRMKDLKQNNVQQQPGEIAVDLGKKRTVELNTGPVQPNGEIILDDEPEDPEVLFQHYEEYIMKPIKPLDALLKKVPEGMVHYDEYTYFAKSMFKNAELSEKFGTEIVAAMHRIIAKALLLVRSRELMPGRDVLESIRACLIVIVALVRSKDVDINLYLNKAEEFGRRINTLKIKED